MSSQCPFSFAPSPLLIVLSGPSGAGKDTVLTRLKEVNPRLQHIITVTTRSQRPNEVDNVHYHFVSENKFQRMIQKNELLEWAKVYGSWYGVPRGPVKDALNKGLDTIVKVDVQGAATIRKAVPGAVLIFLTAPSIEDLSFRLKQRRTESADSFTLRLDTARTELKQLCLFDYIVFSRWDELERAVADIQGIIAAEKCRVVPRKVNL